MPTAEEGERLSVLLVEDEVLLRLALADVLRARGMRVIEAASGEEARDLLLAGVDADIVFSDISMPGALDGPALAGWIAENDAEIVVLLTSAQPHALAAARSACPQVKAFVAKPYDHDHVAELIVAVVGSRE